MLTFASVLKSGGEYKTEHVERLVYQVSAHYTEPFNFICLSDHQDVACDRIELQNDWPGWWSKLELFQHDLGKVCYLDLDVTVQSSLHWIDKIDPGEQLFGMNDALWKDNLNSSVMIWQGQKLDVVEGFSKAEIKKWNKGPDRWVDQGWIQNKLGENLKFISDENVCSYKFGKDQDKTTASILVFHGKPKPWDL